MTPPVTSAVAKLVPSTVAVPESPEGAVKPSPGAAMVVAEAPPIAEPSRWALERRLPERSVAVTLIVPATIAANPSPCMPVEAVARRGDHGDVHRRELADQLVTCWPAPAVVGEPVLCVVSTVGQRHVDRGDVVLGVIVDHPLQSVGDAVQAGRVGAVGDAQGDDLDARRDAQVVGIVGTDQSGDGRAVLRGGRHGIAGVVGEIVAGDDLVAGAEAAAQGRVIVIDAGVDHGDGHARAVTLIGRARLRRRR